MNKLHFSLCCLAAALVFFGLGACKTIRSEAVKSAPDIHTTRLSSDWAGEYTGVIPTASGRKMSVNLILYCAETFNLSYSYIDKPDVSFLLKGKIKWDKTERFITIEAKDFPPYYWVFPERLIQVDRKGTIIKGDQGEYCLMKK